MKTSRILLIAILALTAALSVLGNNGGSPPSLIIGKEDPLSVLSAKLQCDTIYRIQFPLREWSRQMVVVLGFPSYASAKATGAKDAYAFAVKHSRLLVFLFAEGEAQKPREIAVDEVLFSRLLSAVVSSEVFNLPAIWKPGATDYAEVGALDGGPVVVERLQGSVQTVNRAYGQSTPVTWLADRIKELLASKVSFDEAPVGNAARIPSSE